MRKIILISLLSWVVAWAYALQVTTTVPHTILIEDADTLIIFNGNPELCYPTAVDWYDHATGALLQSNTDCNLSLNDGTSVRLSHVDANDTIALYHVFDYTQNQPRLQQISFDLLCDATMMGLAHEENFIPSLQYTTLQGRNKRYYYPLTIEMKNLTFTPGGHWVDTTVTISGEVLEARTYSLPPLYISEDQQVVLRYDSIPVLLGVDPLQAQTTTWINQAPIAIGYRPVGLINKRGQSDENEIDRPVVDSLAESGFQASAPLDVQFRANATPNAEFFLWRIYRGSQLLAQRTDENHRYEFQIPGTYRVVCYAGNPHCPCDDGVYLLDCPYKDSVEVSTFTITVSRLAVPNVFTPDGNGFNDEFRVLYRSLESFQCKVYNRWGKLVYEWSDPAKGWDGYINGRPAAEGAYYYVIRAKGTDGVIYKKSGDINLLRQHGN